MSLGLKAESGPDTRPRIITFYWVPSLSLMVSHPWFLLLVNGTLVSCSSILALGTPCSTISINLLKLGCLFTINLTLFVIMNVTPSYIPRTRIARLNGNSMFTFLMNCQTVFQSGYTVLHSHQQYMKVPISPYPYQHLLLSFWVFPS